MAKEPARAAVGQQRQFAGANGATQARRVAGAIVRTDDMKTVAAHAHFIERPRGFGRGSGTHSHRPFAPVSEPRRALFSARLRRSAQPTDPRASPYTSARSALRVAGAVARATVLSRRRAAARFVCACRSA